MPRIALRVLQLQFQIAVYMSMFTCPIVVIPTPSPDPNWRPILANQQDYELALLKLKAGGELTKEQLDLLKKAAQQAGAFGNEVRAALKDL